MVHNEHVKWKVAKMLTQKAKLGNLGRSKCIYNHKLANLGRLINLVSWSTYATIK